MSQHQHRGSVTRREEGSSQVQFCLLLDSCWVCLFSRLCKATSVQEELLERDEDRRMESNSDLFLPFFSSYALCACDVYAGNEDRWRGLSQL